MKIFILFHDFTRCLLHLLLLAELFVHTSSHPATSPSLCRMFRSMIHQVDRLMSFSKNLHDLVRLHSVLLESLPHIQHSFGYFSSLTVNKSISDLYVYTQSLKLHVDWLKTAKENVSLSYQSAEATSPHLLQLSNLLNVSLHQIGEETPQSMLPSFPLTYTAFDVLQFSVEISGQLQVFCSWSKRVLIHLQRLSHCPKH
uniref:Ciliary neurotrophic factor n=1 Tax=Mola mola TaxID=94237 RepID=A0A3Q3WX82_MOLML